MTSLSNKLGEALFITERDRLLKPRLHDTTLLYIS